MGANLGFDIIIPSDATYAFARKSASGRIHAAELVHDVALASLSTEFALITTTDAVLAQAVS